MLHDCRAQIVEQLRQFSGASVHGHSVEDWSRFSAAISFFTGALFVRDKEDGEERIENTVEAADDGRRDLGRNPKGWHEFSPICCVVLLANIRDIGFVALLDLSENRDSASRVSLC